MSENSVKYRIVDQRTGPSFRPERRGQADMTITYQMDGADKDMVTIPAEDADVVKAKLAVEDHIREKLKYIGQTGEVPR